MKKFLVLIGALALLGGVFWTAQQYKSLRAMGRQNRINEDAENLFVALQKYKEHVGAYPRGGNAEIARALKGQNPKNVIILVGRKNELNEKGELVDPWNTPLRIYFTDVGILVRSAGPNRRFDDSTIAESDDFFRSN
jgi:hypothetical protein